MTAAEPLPLFVSEVFGPTIQGEGPALGQSCAFLRLAYCNLACSWCDTPYTWDWTGKNGLAYSQASEITRHDPESLAAELLGMHTPLVVLSGGEPLIQHRALRPLLELLRDANRVVDVETNGTVIPSFPADLVRRYVVSPKLRNSGNPARRLNPAAMEWFYHSGLAVLKFVVSSPGDLAEVEGLVRRFRFRPEQVYIMPEGRTSYEVLCGMEDLMAPVASFGWTLTPRLHILLWGNARGR